LLQPYEDVFVTSAVSEIWKSRRQRIDLCWKSVNQRSIQPTTDRLASPAKI